MPRFSVRSSSLNPRSIIARSFSFFVSLWLIVPSFVLPPVNAQQQQRRSRQTLAQVGGMLKSGAPVQGKTPDFVAGEVLVRFRQSALQKGKSTDFSVTLRASDATDESNELRGDIAANVESTEGEKIVSGLRLARVKAEDTLLAVKRFNERDDVLYAEPNYIYHVSTLPNDSRFSEMWGLKNTGQVGCIRCSPDFPPSVSGPGTPGYDIHAEQAWDITQGSSNVVVGVIDEGVDIDHPDLRANIWRNAAEIPNNGIDDDVNGKVDDINGWDFFSNDNNVRPNTADEAHGTHVSGIIGASGNNGTGITGVNWRVGIMSLRVGDAQGLSNSALLGAYAYAKTMRDLWISSGGRRGANIRALNNSYGGPGFSQSAFNAIRALSESGVLFVAAAGNDNTNNDLSPSYPTNYAIPNVIAVAATNRLDELGAFSQYGAQTVHLGAPGVSILSTMPNNGYSLQSGTSMASPMVTGAAALVCAANPNLGMAQLRGVLLYNGDKRDSLVGKTSTGRRLNVYNSILAELENDTTAPAQVGNLRSRISGRRLTVDFTAPGDDGNSGQAAEYNILFRAAGATEGTEILLPTSILPAPAGTPQSVGVNIPYRNFSGTLLLRVIDNSGNSSTTPINVALSIRSGNDPYTQTVSNVSEPLSSGGTPLNLRGDDVMLPNYNLPFAFPFYGQL